MDPFKIADQLSNDCFLVKELKLSTLLLMNDTQYPWFILVPRVANVTEIYQLSVEQQHVLIDEISQISQMINQFFGEHKLNVGALGNLVSQLHVHVIGRTQRDPAWPGPVWGASPAIAYTDSRVRTLIAELNELI